MQNIIARGTSTHPLAPRAFVAGLALAAAAVVAAVGVALAPSLSFSNPATVPADHSYTRVEALRADAFARTAADGSADQAERTRGGAFGSGGTLAVDPSYDQVEGVRSRIVLPAADSSYDDIEGLRSQR